MAATTRSNYTYRSENVNFACDFDELRTVVTISALLYEVITHTEAKYVSMNMFCQGVFRLVPNIYFSYDIARYVLILLANEQLYEGETLKQVGSIVIEQDAGTTTKKIKFKGEYGEQRLRERVDYIMELSQAELAEFEKFGVHREKGNRRAFRMFSEWKSDMDNNKKWMAFMSKLLSLRR